jgi:hypothetical protein
MEENLKNAISAMRKDIAELEKEQKNIKPQRKTVYYTGERTMSPFDAWCTVGGNKEKLRLMYAAYNLLRGKGFEITERSAKPLIYDRSMYWAYPCGLKGQHYTADEAMDGKHPLCEYLNDINSILKEYGYEFKNYETRKDRWGGEYRAISLENYEEVVCLS